MCSTNQESKSKREEDRIWETADQTQASDDGMAEISPSEKSLSFSS